MIGKPQRYRIEVSFRKATAYTRAQTAGNYITGEITLYARRAYIEGILADYNVAAYRIIECDDPLQVMSGFQTMPDFYYK